MTNSINVDLSIIHDNNKLLDQFKHERTKLDLIKYKSSSNTSLLINENFKQILENTHLIFRSNSITTTFTPSSGISSRLRGMAEKLRPQILSTIKPDEIPIQNPVVLEAKSLSSIPSGDFESLDLSSQPGIKDLLISAEGLLSRLQNAYVQRTSALNNMIVSRDNLAEELEESNTRTQNLRSQLGELANTISMKDQRIAELERELLEAKSKSCYCQPSFNNSIEFQNSASSPLLYDSTDHVGKFSEDHIYDNQSGIGSEMENESDCDSSMGDGIFSRPLSPALTNTSSILIGSPYLRPVTNPNPTPSPLSSGVKTNHCIEKPKTQPAKSLFAFLSGRSSNKEVHPSNQESCTNCEGKDSSAAWDAVSLLQVENKGLKGRIVELENVIDGALDAIMGYY